MQTFRKLAFLYNTFLKEIILTGNKKYVIHVFPLLFK